jgi:hypothetical protein
MDEMNIEDIAQLPADPPLDEELSTDDVVYEIANLDKSQTGNRWFHLDFHFYDGARSKSKIFHQAWTDTAKLLDYDI